MNIRLVTHHAVLAESVCRALRARGHEVEVRPDTVFDSELRYAPTLIIREILVLARHKWHRIGTRRALAVLYSSLERLVHNRGGPPVVA